MRLDDIHSMRVRDVTDGYAQTMDAREYFTCGRCWELAEALGEIVPGGRIVEIRVSIASISMLLPAGVESGGFVHDIEGTNEVSEWIARWSGNLEGATMALRKGRGQIPGVRNSENDDDCQVLRPNSRYRPFDLGRHRGIRRKGHGH
jgi:hypothetical protein